jgi:plasmid maintenance system antidote protein VapI
VVYNERPPRWRFKFFGNGASIWLDMQSDYDLWTSEQRIAAKLARIEPN